MDGSDGSLYSPSEVLSLACTIILRLVVLASNIRCASCNDTSQMAALISFRGFVDFVVEHVVVDPF